MAENTVAFTLTPSAYQDVSGGYDICSFRLNFASGRDNVIRVCLSDTLPDPDTENYDQFMAPQTVEDEWQMHFTGRAVSRVYLRANSASAHPLRIVVYRA